MPNDLTPNDWLAKRISPVLTPDLKRLLESDDYQHDPVAQIANTMCMRMEAEQVLPELKAAAFQKAGEEGVRQVIGRRFAIYPQPDRSDAEWAAWWADYVETLEGITWAGLDAAMSAYVADPTSEFMPKPGRLLDLSRTTPNKSARYYERARRALAYEHQPPPGKPTEARVHTEPTPEDKARVAALMADYQSKFADRMPAALRPTLPSIHGKADETGITPQMRAIMERRAGE